MKLKPPKWEEGQPSNWNYITVDTYHLRTFTRYYCNICKEEVDKLVSTNISKDNPNGGWICAVCHNNPIREHGYYGKEEL